MRIGDLVKDSDSLILVSKILGKDKVWVLSHLDETVGQSEFGKILKALRMLRSGVPIQYILGYKEFMSLRFEVAKGVFIPRYETETLVEKAIEIVKKHGLKIVADVGTGTGAIGISIAKYTGCRVLATDISERAVEIAKRNAEINGVGDIFEVRLGEYLEPFKSSLEEIEMVVSNPPYVEAGADLPTNVKYEPKEALFAGEDGLDFFREFFSRYDTTDKYILMEFSGKRKDELVEIVGKRVEFLKDLDGVERFFLITPSQTDL